MLNDNPQLHGNKTEFLIIGTPQQLEKVEIMSIRVGNSDVYPVPTARNLGSWFDSIGCPSRSILQRSAFLHFSICTTYDASGIIYHKPPPRHSFMHAYPVVLTTATAYYIACLIPY